MQFQSRFLLVLSFFTLAAQTVLAGVRVGYFEGWSLGRTCNKFAISDIKTNAWTHLNYAFALINGNNQIVPNDQSEIANYGQFNALKQSNPSLKTLIAVGGWNMGPGPWQQMIATQQTRNTFIQSVIAFNRQYGFDGIDIDFEYPSSSDAANLLSFVRELRAAAPSILITMALPAGAYNLANFDLAGMAQYMSWYNVMAYDEHGSWDNPPNVAPHTSIADIDPAIQYILNKGVPASKVVLGLAFYGHSYTLSNPSCKTPGCQFSGPGTAGPCSQAAGTLTLYEIQNALAQNAVTGILDRTNMYKYASYGNQWVTYDDQDTFPLKLGYVNQKSLGGYMVWPIDGETSQQVMANGLATGNFASAPSGGSSSSTTMTTSTTKTTSSTSSTTSTTKTTSTTSTTSKTSSTATTTSKTSTSTTVSSTKKTTSSTTTTKNTKTTTTSAPTTTTSSTPVQKGVSTTATSTAFAAPPAPTTAGTTASCYKWYTVQSGDYCSKITDQFSITLAQFYSWNTGVNNPSCNNLWVGYAYCVKA